MRTYLPPNKTFFRHKLGTTVARDLRTVMQGKVAIAGEASYEGARRVFNGTVGRWPALFAFCESARDVQEAVRAARAYSLPLSVRGGGHDWAGRALSHQGLVVDLSRMRQVDVDLREKKPTSPSVGRGPIENFDADGVARRLSEYVGSRRLGTDSFCLWQ